MAAPVQPVLPQAYHLLHAVGSHRPLPPPRCRRPLRWPRRCYPRRLQDRSALRRVRSPQTPHLQRCRSPPRLSRMGPPRRPPCWNGLDRRSSTRLCRPGWHRLLLQCPRRALRSAVLLGKGVLRAGSCRVRFLGQRHGVHYRGVPNLLRSRFQESGPVQAC